MSYRTKICLTGFLMVAIFIVTTLACLMKFENNQATVVEYQRIAALNSNTDTALYALGNVFSASQAFMESLDKVNLDIALRYYDEANNSLNEALRLVVRASVREELGELLKQLSASRAALMAVHDNFYRLDKYYSESVVPAASIFAKLLEEQTSTAGTKAADFARLWKNFSSLRSYLSALNALSNTDNASNILEALSEMRPIVKGLAGMPGSVEFKKLENSFFLLEETCSKFSEFAIEAKHSLYRMDEINAKALNMAEKLGAEISAQHAAFSQHMRVEFENSKSSIITAGVVGVSLSIMLAMFLVLTAKASIPGPHTPGQASIPGAYPAQRNPQRVDDAVRAISDLSRNLAGTSETLNKVAEDLRRG